MRVYKNYLMDMDGVLVRGRTAIPGAAEFIARLNAQSIPYLVTFPLSAHPCRAIHRRSCAARYQSRYQCFSEVDLLWRPQ